MQCLDEEHKPVLLPPQTKLPNEVKEQPGEKDWVVPDAMSCAVLSGRSSAVAAASHSLVVMMRPPPQEPLSIM